MYLSEEQKIIVNKSNDNINIRCNSCAGSGKTSTIHAMVKEQKNKNFVILTYNALLRKETESRIIEPNSTCHTFHSFANKY